MADYAGLKAEIARPAYAGMADAAVLAALNAPGAAVPQPIPAVWVASYFGLTGLRGTIEDVSQDKAHPLRSACLGLIDFFWGVGAGRVFDVTDPNLLGMLGAFVQAGLMTQAQRDALVYSNAAPGPSVAAGLGFPSVTAPDLARARSLP
jgi:hypothetical protein